jgi:hypothetical protein
MLQHTLTQHNNKNVNLQGEEKLSEQEWIM